MLNYTKQEHFVFVHLPGVQKHLDIRVRDKHNKTNIFLASLILAQG